MSINETNQTGPAAGLVVRLARHAVRATVVAAGAAVCAGASAVLLIPVVLAAGSDSVRRMGAR